jgi:hypothetical protein
MLKNITLSVLCILCFNLKTQAQFSIDEDSLFTSGSYSDFELVAHTKIRNTTSNPDTLIWNRIVNSLSPNWTSAVCDIYNCHGETVDQYAFTLPANHVGDISFHLYPNGFKGTGKMVVRFVRKSNPSYYIDVVINSQAYGLGLNALQNNTFRITPNPASGSLSIGNSNIEEGTFEIYNILGIKVMGDRFISSQKIDVSSLTKGIYMITIRNGNAVATNKLIIE